MINIIFKSFVTSIAVAGLTFLINIVTARQLGPDGRGEYSSIIMIVTLTSALLQLGLGSSFLYKSRAIEKWPQQQYFLLSIAFITTLAIISIFIIHNQISNKININFITLSILTSVYSAHTFILQTAQIQKNLTLYNQFKLVLPLALFLGALIAISMGSLSANSLVQTQTVLGATILLLSAFAAHKKIIRSDNERRSIDGIELRSYLLLGLKFHTTVSLGLITTNIDKLYLFVTGSFRDFGIYSVAFTMSRIIGLFQEAVSTALFSQHAGTTDNITNTIITSFRTTFYPLLVICILISILSKPIIVSIFGGPYAEASLPFSILLFECVISGSSWILAQQFNATGRPGIVLIRQIFSIAPIIILLPFLGDQNIITKLALLLLLGATLRLMITIYIFKITLKIRLADFLLKKTDVIAIGQIIQKRFK